MASKHDMFRYGLIHFGMFQYRFGLHLVTGGGGGGGGRGKGGGGGREEDTW